MLVSSQGEQEAYNLVQVQVTVWPASGVVHRPGLVIALMDTVIAVCRQKLHSPVVVHCR